MTKKNKPRVAVTLGTSGLLAPEIVEEMFVDDPEGTLKELQRRLASIGTFREEEAAIAAQLKRDVEASGVSTSTFLYGPRANAVVQWATIEVPLVPKKARMKPEEPEPPLVPKRGARKIVLT